MPNQPTQQTQPTDPAVAHAILLRGVNVGGVTMRMAELRDVLGRLPLQDVGTVLASGNVVCRTALPAVEVKRLTEDALRRHYGYQAWVVVVPADHLRAVAASVPAAPPAGPAAQDDVHTYVTFFSDVHAQTALLEDARDLEDRPAVLEGAPAVAWFSPKGRSTEVPLAKLLARRRYASTTTTRNAATVRKILRQMP